jgi:hypothetical protein
MTSDDIIAFLKQAKAAGFRDPQLSFTLHDGDGIDLRFEGVKGDVTHGHCRCITLTGFETARFAILKKELALIQASLNLRPLGGWVPEEDPTW